MTMQIVGDQSNNNMSDYSTVYFAASSPEKVDISICFRELHKRPLKGIVCRFREVDDRCFFSIQLLAMRWESTLISGFKLLNGLVLYKLARALSLYIIKTLSQSYIRRLLKYLCNNDELSMQQTKFQFLFYRKI